MNNRLRTICQSVWFFGIAQLVFDAVLFYTVVIR